MISFAPKVFVVQTTGSDVESVHLHWCISKWLDVLSVVFRVYVSVRKDIQQLERC